MRVKQNLTLDLDLSFLAELCYIFAIKVEQVCKKENHVEFKRTGRHCRNWRKFETFYSTAIERIIIKLIITEANIQVVTNNARCINFNKIFLLNKEKFKL